jgi:hypothetical protein
VSTDLTKVSKRTERRIARPVVLRSGLFHARSEPSSAGSVISDPKSPSCKIFIKIENSIQQV